MLFRFLPLALTTSGKSTLLNNMWRTNFKQMDADAVRHKTTRGIWMAKCPGVEPTTIVMDLEGTDGCERGQDDTAFGRQSALFGLAVSDIVMINMWCTDIGRENAANRPLLKTVFGAIMTMYENPVKINRRTLIIVIRDKSKASEEKTVDRVKKDMQEIWNSVPKPEAFRYTSLTDIFDLQVQVLSSYERDEEQFKRELVDFKKKLLKMMSITADNQQRQGVIAAPLFSLTLETMWKKIKEDKNLDLPSVMEGY